MVDQKKSGGKNLISSVLGKRLTRIDFCGALFISKGTLLMGRSTLTGAREKIILGEI